MEEKLNRLKNLLEEKVRLYNQPSFIMSDPISIPHIFNVQQDIEISGFFAAVLAWGNRASIINSCKRLLQWMDNAPHDFILHHQEQDLKSFLHFAHRTFNATDLLYFIFFLKHHYTRFASLEDAFVSLGKYTSENVGDALIHFHQYFFSMPHPERTQKHIATPLRKSACKRLNMYLRWMVRNDKNGVDFGLWRKINMSQLICPLDVHVARVAHRLELLPNQKSDWKNAVMLTEQLKILNPKDPARYDFALFGIGVAERF